MMNTKNVRGASAPHLFVQQVILSWESPLWSTIFATALYFGLSFFYSSPFKTSIYPYFNYLADAFLHGQLNLRLLPPMQLDLIHLKENYYLYWPPFPAILLLPWIAIWGVGFWDIPFTIFLGGINVGLMALLLRECDQHKIIELSAVKRGILVLFFGFGTVYITMVPMGRVWFTSIVIGVSCVLLAYLAAIRYQGRKAFFLAGLAMAGALATRNHLLFAGIWPAWYLIRRHKSAGFHQLIRFILVGVTPVLSFAILLAIYNYVRFGNPLDVGLKFHLMSEFFYKDFQKYGAFNLYYLPTNFYYQLIAYPFPTRAETFMGGSLFLLSPVFFIALLALWKERFSWSTWILFLTMVVVDIPILLLMGTGWVQFGPRYTLDFIVPLMMLTASGIKHVKTRIVVYLLLMSLAHYVSGYIIFAKTLALAEGI